jgi:type I restriction enzyme S subunit
VPIVRVADLEGDAVRASRPLRVSADVESAYARTRLVGGEVLVSIVGTVGRVAVAPQSLAGWNVARAVAVLKPRSGADSDWIRYALLSDDAQRQMGIRKTDTVQATLNLRDLRSVTLPWPEADVRQRIVGVLGALDDLIETNRQQISRLRDTAQVCFDAAAQVGDEVTFGDVAHLVREGVSANDLSVGTHYLGLEHFNTGGAGIAGVGDAGGMDSGKSRFTAGDVLYGKLRPYFRKYDRPGFDGVCSTEIWVLRGTEPYGSATVAALVRRPEFTDFATQGSGGTRMPRADWRHVASMAVAVPRREQLEDVEAHLNALWRARVALQDEITDLTRVRDELLPLLMSGRVRVREVA